MTWVSAKDRMPRDDEFVVEHGMYGVLTWDKYNGYNVTWYNSPAEAREWLPAADGASHWARLLPPPTGPK